MEKNTKPAAVVIMTEHIEATPTYQAITCPIKRQIITQKGARDKITQGVNIAKEKGFEFWKNLYQPPASRAGVVKDLLTVNL